MLHPGGDDQPAEPVKLVNKLVNLAIALPTTVHSLPAEHRHGKHEDHHRGGWISQPPAAERHGINRSPELAGGYQHAVRP